MKIREVAIRNFRSLENVRFQVGDVLALTGRNNSGKSNIIRALEFFFNPSVRSVSQESFKDHDTSRTISIRVTFEDLSNWEKESFDYWVDGDSLTISREIFAEGEGFNILPVAHVRVPEPEWLREDQISAEKIRGWWADKDQLVIGDLDFAASLGSARPTVGDLKERAQVFVEEHRAAIPHTSEKLINPKGAPNILKGALPEFVLIPAVRDVSDEAKVQQTNPFGRLIHATIERIPEAQRTQISEELQRVAHRLNREGGEERFEAIIDLERRLNELMAEFMDCDVELELPMPQLRQVFGDARIFVDDGVRTEIGAKGHGMQRAMILTILRHYAELSAIEKAGDRAGERSTIVAFEEPELYLHPQAQRTLMGIFRVIAGGRDQVLYTTHSSLFVDVAYFDEICLVQRSKRGNTISSEVTQLTMDMMLKDLFARRGKKGTAEGIRRLYSNAFDPQVNEGFFADKVVVVEGPSEQYALPIYALALGLDFDRLNVSVVHSDGKGPMDRLLRVFNGLRIPTYVWFDGDKSGDDPENDRKTLELLELLGEPVEDLSQLETTVTGSYAVMGENLEEQLRAEIPDYSKLIADCSREYGKTGKPLKHRFVAQAVAAQAEAGQDPSQTVPATIRAICTEVEKLTYDRSILHPQAEAARPLSQDPDDDEEEGEIS